MQPVLLSIDVGTHALRSALVDLDGQVLAHNEEPLLVWKTALTLEFSSNNIWQALTHSVNRLLRENPITPDLVKSIGIDATYSIVLLGKEMTPVPLPQSPKANILGWMDHRSARQAHYIASSHPGLLNGAGSQVTPETNLCKLLWLYQEAPDTWKQTRHLMDLCDFLTWKCTGCKTLSPTSTGSGIPAVEFAELGIDVQGRLGGEQVPFCSAIGSGLTPDSAEQLGLKPGTPVATGMIDSLGGTLATIMAHHWNDRDEDTPVDITRRLSMIGGTSSVYMAFHQQAIKAHGIGGPFPSPLPGYHMNFVRQTAGGALIDHVLTSHPAFIEVQNSAVSLGISVYQFLNQLLTKMASGHCSTSELTRDLHVLPYFAGNHCPRVDMSLQGMITGLTLDKSQESLARVYLATLQALALGARHNFEHLEQAGYQFELLMPAGGLARNPLFIQEHINAMNCPAAMPEQHNPMLMSGALTGAVAAGIYPDIEKAMGAMTRYAEIIKPEAQLNSFYDRKYSVFLELYEDQMKYRRLMK